MLDGLLGGTHDVLHTALRGLSMREQAIAENLANIDTPRYKKREVEFEAQLREWRKFKHGESDSWGLALTHRIHTGGGNHFRIDRTHPVHFALGPSSINEVQPMSWRSEANSFRNDDNNVDIDLEMSLLAQTELSYNAISELMKRSFDGLKGVIRGG